jgi:hypothetical protein
LRGGMGAAHDGELNLITSATFNSKRPDLAGFLKPVRSILFIFS